MTSSVLTVLYVVFIFSRAGKLSHFAVHSCQNKDGKQNSTIHDLHSVLTGAKLSLHSGDKLCTGSYINGSIM